MEKYIMALDAGTTSSRCIIFDKRGDMISVSQKKFNQYFPQPGWVEHDPLEIWETQYRVCKEAVEQAGLSAANIAGLGITNQRETTIVWDRKTGTPVYNAIVWQCRRTSDYCDKLVAEGWSDKIKEKTGLLIDPYFSGTKIRWILENVPGARKKAEAGDLLFGTVDTWLIWNLTDGRVHVTDYSNASRTMLFNIHTLSWDKDILELLGIPESMLPQVKSSSTVFGYTDEKISGMPIPISGAAGDQQCALFGQTCFDKGDVKNTYGTGGFLLMNTGEKPVTSKNGLVTTIAWGLDEKVYYAIEGSIFVSGAALQWLRDGLGIIEKSSDSLECAMAVPDTAGVYVVPAFTGLGAPYWDPYARGTIVGLTRGTNKNHIVRATLESMAYQAYDVIHAMEQDCDVRITSLKVDGGASANDFLLQFQSDIIQATVMRPTCIETTALGAAYLAGLAVGYWDSIEDIKKNWAVEACYNPSIGAIENEKLLKGWHKAVGRSLSWDKE